MSGSRVNDNPIGRLLLILAIHIVKARNNLTQILREVAFFKKDFVQNLHEVIKTHDFIARKKGLAILPNRATL